MFEARHYARVNAAETVQLENSLIAEATIKVHTLSTHLHDSADSRNAFTNRTRPLNC